MPSAGNVFIRWKSRKFWKSAIVMSRRGRSRGRTGGWAQERRRECEERKSTTRVVGPTLIAAE
jgi:hypothetical protein